MNSKLVTILNDFNDDYVKTFHNDLFMDFDKRGEKLYANSIKKSINKASLISYSLKGYDFGNN